MPARLRTAPSAPHNSPASCLTRYIAAHFGFMASPERIVRVLKSRLERAREGYQIALQHCIKATMALDPYDAGFERSYDVAVVARLDFELARAEYQRHVSEHGCGPKIA